MKHNIWSIIFIGLGIFCIFIGATSLGNQQYIERLAVKIITIGIALIVLSLLGMVPNTKSDNIKEAEKFNFRETDNNDNCGECSRFNKKSSDESDVNCKFFHIKTDENHKCDLLQPQLEEENVNKSNTKNTNNHIMNHEELLKKMR
jgi:hypothetical protein